MVINISSLLLWGQSYSPLKQIDRDRTSTRRMAKNRNPKAKGKMVEALNGLRKVGVAGEDGGAGRRSQAWPSPLGRHESLGNRDYPVYNHLTSCKKLLFGDWHYICC